MIEWEVEKGLREFGGADLQLTAYTRGAISWSRRYAQKPYTPMVEGARTYVILDCDNDGEHVSHLHLYHVGRQRRSGQLRSPIIATTCFDNLDAAKAEAERWESLDVEQLDGSRGAEWRLALPERARPLPVTVAQDKMWYEDGPSWSRLCHEVVKVAQDMGSADGLSDLYALMNKLRASVDAVDAVIKPRRSGGEE